VLTRTLLALLACLTAILLIAPLVVIAVLAFNESSFLGLPITGWSLQWFENLFSSGGWAGAAGNSFRIALLVTLLATAFGTLGAFSLVRGRFPFKATFSMLILAPMIVPAVVFALAVYNVGLATGLTQTTAGFVISHTVLAIPYVTISVAASLASFNSQIDKAAMSLGASPWQTFWKVTLPIISPGVAAGALFAFVTSWDEVVIGNFLAGPELTTLPVLMWQGVRVTIDPTVAALSTTLIAFIVLAFVALGLSTMVARALRRPRTSRKMHD
jgi:putative spermidine/putrescine transport system permease protein